jgi:hypothetical protein
LKCSPPINQSIKPCMIFPTPVLTWGGPDSLDLNNLLTHVNSLLTYGQASVVTAVDTEDRGGVCERSLGDMGEAACVPARAASLLEVKARLSALKTSHFPSFPSLHSFRSFPPFASLASLAAFHLGSTNDDVFETAALAPRAAAGLYGEKESERE